MNLDDPKLTAYALDELDEAERQAMAREVNASPEAQHEVEETRTMARLLRSEFATELDHQRDGVAATKPLSANLSDIRDDPWFWTIARPLAIAAALAIFAVIGVITGLGYRSWLAGSSKPRPRSLVDLEVNATSEVAAPFASPDRVPNPWPRDTIQHVEQVVIGELEPGNELRVIETIKDGYRLQRLQNRLATSELSKRSDDRVSGRDYELILLDRTGRILAGAVFRCLPGVGFVLQPFKNVCERNGRYFLNGCAVDLPGEWRSDINYQEYAMPFPDWVDCIGYIPGA